MRKSMSGSRMAALSKTLTCSCYELGHTWDPSCMGSFYFVAKHVFITALKIYTPLYLAAAIYRKKGKAYFKKKFWMEVLRSTTFLAVNGAGYIGSFCLWRRLTGFFFFYNAFICGIPPCILAINIEAPKRQVFGNFSFLSVSFLPAFGASLVAITLERESRRGALALYLFNVALETVYRMLSCRGVVPMFKNGEVLIFSLATAVYMYFAKIKDGLDKSLQSGLKFIFGAHEFPKPTAASDTDTTAPRSKAVASKSFGWPSWLQYIVKLIQQGPKHDVCKHQYSCLSYVLQGFSRNFVIGYGIQAAVTCLKSVTSIIRKPKTVIKALLHSDNIGLAAFLALFSGSFRAINCILRWVRDKDHPLHGAVAGFLSGWSLMFYKSTNIAVYILAKLIEVLYTKGAEAGKLPNIKHGNMLVYSLSTALVFHAVVFEPHNIRPAYWKFLLRVTMGRFATMNRKLLDVFGTNASRIDPDFWPDYDMRYTSITKPV